MLFRSCVCVCMLESLCVYHCVYRGHADLNYSMIDDAHDGDRVMPSDHRGASPVDPWSRKTYVSGVELDLQMG